VGYAAAIAHRGVRLIRMPTTVLSQNDAGVGVKNGINALGRKNFLGTFAPPFAVIIDDPIRISGAVLLKSNSCRLCLIRECREICCYVPPILFIVQVERHFCTRFFVTQKTL
ncbi:MAG TPA: hypothetical protein VLA51_12830, partial [Paracoccaceae bacterium]|nr:hypothetical protein [Paracoccaceae bacterium]